MPRVVGTRGRTRTVGWSGRLTSVTHDMLTTGGERRRNASNTYASETRPPQARRPVSGAAGPIFRWKKPQTPLGAHPLRGTHDPPEPRAATSIKRHAPNLKFIQIEEGHRPRIPTRASSYPISTFNESFCLVKILIRRNGNTADFFPRQPGPFSLVHR